MADIMMNIRTAVPDKSLLLQRLKENEEESHQIEQRKRELELLMGSTTTATTTTTSSTAATRTALAGPAAPTIQPAAPQFNSEGIIKSMDAQMEAMQALFQSRVRKNTAARVEQQSEAGTEDTVPEQLFTEPVMYCAPVAGTTTTTSLNRGRGLKKLVGMVNMTWKAGGTGKKAYVTELDQEIATLKDELRYLTVHSIDNSNSNGNSNGSSSSSSATVAASAAAKTRMNRKGRSSCTSRSCTMDHDKKTRRSSSPFGFVGNAYHSSRKKSPARKKARNKSPGRV